MKRCRCSVPDPLDYDEDRLWVCMECGGEVCSSTIDKSLWGDMPECMRSPASSMMTSALDHSKPARLTDEGQAGIVIIPALVDGSASSDLTT